MIDEVRKRGDSCGGEVTCVIRACPKGLGSPVFDKLEAELAKALMSLPASKVGLQLYPGLTGYIDSSQALRPSTLQESVGHALKNKYSTHAKSSLCVLQGIEIGSGFSGSRMLGSEHNDEFYMEDGHVRTRTNR